ncbi:MAG: hypothetical protein ACK50D_09140, partial [Burkholderiales bacterium]
QLRPQIIACCAFIACISGCMPRIFIIRFRLYASTCKLISVLTRGSVLSGNRTQKPSSATRNLQKCQNPRSGGDFQRKTAENARQITTFWDFGEP